MILNREEAIEDVMRWYERTSKEHEPRIDLRPDADSLTHSITSGFSWRVGGYIAACIMDFAREAMPLKIDLSCRKVAETLVDCILENVPGVHAEKTFIDADSHESVLAEARV